MCHCGGPKNQKELKWNREYQLLVYVMIGSMGKNRTHYKEKHRSFTSRSNMTDLEENATKITYM
jgi:hypothetical protein